MKWFYDPAQQFHMWEKTHLATLAIIVSLYSILYLARHSLRRYRKVIRITVGMLLILSRISLDVWYVATGTWDIRRSLPLELCSLASLVGAVMLWTKSKFLFETFYFIGIAGALQAIITPDLHFGFPQYRYVQFFTDHFLLILSPLLMIWLYDYTITKVSLMKAFLTINGIAAIVFMINILLDANYMFLRDKPASASLLDILGPYPVYLFALEIIALILFFILFLPFIRRREEQAGETQQK